MRRLRLTVRRSRWVSRRAVTAMSTASRSSPLAAAQRPTRPLAVSCCKSVRCRRLCGVAEGSSLTAWLHHWRRSFLDTRWRSLVARAFKCLCSLGATVHLFMRAYGMDRHVHIMGHCTHKSGKFYCSWLGILHAMDASISPRGRSTSRNCVPWQKWARQGCQTRWEPQSDGRRLTGPPVSDIRRTQRRTALERP